MNESCHRHDISNELWSLIEPHIIGQKGTMGGNSTDTRKFINAVFWILRTGAPWRDLPSTYGSSVVFVAGGTKIFGSAFLKPSSASMNANGYSLMQVL